MEMNYFFLSNRIEEYDGLEGGLLEVLLVVGFWGHFYLEEGKSLNMVLLI